MIHKLKIWNNHLLKLEENISYMFLFMVILLVFCAALLRTAGLPQSWMNDLAKLLFGWVVFLGSDIALAQNKHIGIEFIEEKLPPKARLFVSVLWSVIIILFLLFSIRYGLILAEKNRREFDSILISQAGSIRIIIIFISLYIFTQYYSRNIKEQWRQIIVSALIVTALIFMTSFFFSKEVQSLSYAYLITAVPVGCALMVRTEAINIFKKWEINR